MSLGKMTEFIDIVSQSVIYDNEGFGTIADNVLASDIRAYKENRFASEKWANMAAFSTASCLFRFRVIPALNVTTEYKIRWKNELYNILTVDNYREKGMYIDCLAEKYIPSMK